MGPINLIGSIASVIGLAISVIYITVSAAENDWTSDVTTSIYVMALISTCFLFISISQINKRLQVEKILAEKDPEVAKFTNKIKQLQKEQQELHRKIASVTFTNHNLNNEFRNRLVWLFELVKSKAAGNKIDAIKFKDMERLMSMFLLYFLSNLKEQFDTLTNDNCAVCIKLLVPEDSSPEGILVKTYMRDPVSYRARRPADLSNPIYPITGNTAFRRILSNHTDDTFFLSNSLKDQSGYENLNACYEDTYNATVVVPIRRHIEKSCYQYLGFLCVDNRQGNFLSERDVDLLKSSADLLFLLFLVFFELTDDVVSILDHANEEEN